MKKYLIIFSAVVLLILLGVGIFVLLNNTKELYNVCTNNKCGYVDKNNKVVIPMAFEDAYPFEYGVAVLKYKGYFGALTKSKKNIVPFRYSYLKPLSKDKFVACLFLDENKAPKNCGLIGKNEKVIVPFKYYDVKIEKNKIFVKDTFDSDFHPYKP